MIKSEEGMVKITGKIPDVLTDYCCITTAVKECLEKHHSEDSAKEMLKDSFEMAFLSEEELKKKRNALLRNFIKETLKEIAEGFGADKESEEKNE